MKILMVSSYLPYPLYSGGHIRLFNILKELSRKHKITLVCEKRDYQTENDVREVGRFCQKIITFPRKKQWSLKNILKTAISCFPFLMVGHTQSEMKKKILEEINQNKYDLVHVETFYVMQNIPEVDLPLVLVEQNIEYLVYQRFSNQANFFLKPFFFLDILKIKYWEERFWKKASQIIVTSEEEKRKIKKPRISVIPNGVDLRKFKMQNEKLKIGKKEKTALFIGDFRWLENRDAVEWLLKEIWPKILLEVRSKKLEIRLKLWIVGKDIPWSIKKLESEGVIFDEKAPDKTALIYQKADLLLAPIRVGGGTKFKILESMASGVPVVTTTIGVEGLEAKNGEAILIGDLAEELVKKSIELLVNEVLYEKIARNARVIIEKKYDWGIIVKQLEGVYEQVIHG